MLDKNIQITRYTDFVGEMTNTYRRTKVLNNQIKHSKDAYDFIYPYFDEIMDDHEEFKIIHLNSGGYVVNLHHATTGTDGAVLVSVKDIMRQAILCKTVLLICVHNHPSGTLKPSKPDIDITRKIKEASRLFDITLRDHLILTRESYSSFADEGIL